MQELSCISYTMRYAAIYISISWWRHQMETFSALLAICAGNSPVHGEFLTQWPVTRSFDVSFDRRLNKRLNKQSWGWWLETLSRPLWRHRNVVLICWCLQLFGDQHCYYPCFSVTVVMCDSSLAGGEAPRDIAIDLSITTKRHNECIWHQMPLLLRWFNSNLAMDK